MELLITTISNLNSINRLGDKIKYLQKFDDRQFEYLVADLYAAYGYDTYVTKASNDEGKDVIAVNEDEKIIIECKRYGQESFVGREIVQKLAGVVQIENATKGIIITTNFFNDNAKNYVTKNNTNWITLIDIKGILQLLEDISLKNEWTGNRKDYTFDNNQIADWERRKSYIINQITEKLTIRQYDCIMADRSHISIYPVSLTDKSIIGMAIYSDYFYRKFNLTLKGAGVFRWGKYINVEEKNEINLLIGFEHNSEYLGEKILLNRYLASKYTQHLFNDQLRYTIARTLNYDKFRERERKEKNIRERNKVIERYNQIYRKRLCFKQKNTLSHNEESDIIPFDKEKAKIIDIYY